MQLGLTFPLQRKLHIRSVPYGPPLDRTFCWDLHCITLRGQDSLLLVHCASRYTIVAYGVMKYHWDDVARFAMEQTRAGLLDAGLPEHLVTDYLGSAGGPELTRTHGRREVAFLNRAWEDVLAADLLTDPSCQRQPALNSTVNSLLCRCAGFEGTDSALAFLRRCFAGLS